MNPKKQYYPAFLKNFRDQPFDAKQLEAAYYQARIGGSVRGEDELHAFFAEYKIDAVHWPLHQRILHNEVLYRLIAEGYMHPKVHPVGALYNDKEFYAFVFPFIHTAILKKMADAIQSENLEAVKLLEQWIEPFGTLFRDPFYRMIEYTAEGLQKELAAIKLNRKALPFDTYNRLSPALMHLLNRLPERKQQLRDTFAMQVMELAAWLRNDMKVYTQPTGLMTRLKLLHVSADVHAQRNIQVTQWEKEKEEAGKEKFSLNHLIWIVPVVLLIAFFIWRQTDIGKSADAIIADHQEELKAEKAALRDVQEKIDLRMEGIDLNGLIATELWEASARYTAGGTPSVNPVKRLDNGKMVYNDWLKVGRPIYFTDRVSLHFTNESDCDAVVFLRQTKPPFMERAYYVRSWRNLVVNDDRIARPYTIRVYAGTEWVDSLVTQNFDQKLLAAGVPEEVKGQMPSSVDLRGRFLYPAKSLWDNLQPVEAASVSVSDYQGAPVVILTGNHDKIEFAKPR